MTERMRERLADLRARQAAGEHMNCPRCGHDTMKADLCTNALSRHAGGIYVCDSCGTAEALLDFMKQQLPVHMWAAFRTQKTSDRFKSISSAEALAEIMAEQIHKLTEVYRLCEADPDNSDEYRMEAYEACPGISTLWTQPFAVRYETQDNPIVIRFRMTESGEVQMAVNILGTK